MLAEDWCNKPAGAIPTTFHKSSDPIGTPKDQRHDEKCLPRKEYNADRASATSVSRAKDGSDGPAKELNPEIEANNIAKENTEPPKVIESCNTTKKKNQPSKNA